MMMGIKGPGRPGPYDLLGMFYIIRRDKACLVRLIDEGTNDRVAPVTIDLLPEL